MSSKTTKVATPRFNQCVSEKLIPFKPIKLPQTQCPYHPLRANCRLIKPCDRYDREEDAGKHVTVLQAATGINYNLQPYYMCLLDDAELRGYSMNANEFFGHVQLNKLDNDEEFFGIDAAGEKNMGTIKMVIKSIMDSFATCENYYILMIDELQLDLLFSMFRSIILPQRMVSIHKNNFVTDDVYFKLFSVPVTDESDQSQQIYRTFLMYNTVLTMILKQPNPFNDARKNISVIFRSLGRCPNNKERVKCCDLAYGGNAPNHVMCPPREMVKRVFHYAKWSRTPNNYKRYYEKITNKIDDSRNDQSSLSKYALLTLDWYNFIEDFRTYFGV
ncbi:vp1054 [Cryptophlebia peltastica nucleopolyhedrovirus]|uniref:Vp1054 n=1 Tax=Cryptophlebia peltastica nucleopolyhedrovirus TaxID=2304025 RepID=A0A346RNQ9_9ABAC|nr:vp1054 [Cryptophlebia peltastica nucleopolyhedrovirus]AXS67706.1 vp1054 [Cryptophlebia peltastica nucleopolyhedrovirus]